VSLAIWDHTVLPATRHKWTCSHAGRYSIYIPRKDGRLSWPSWLDSAPAGSRTSDLLITSPTLNQCNHQDHNMAETCQFKVLNLTVVSVHCRHYVKPVNICTGAAPYRLLRLNACIGLRQTVVVSTDPDLNGEYSYRLEHLRSWCVVRWQSSWHAQSPTPSPARWQHPSLTTGWMKMLSIALCFMIMTGVRRRLLADWQPRSQPAGHQLFMHSSSRRCSRLAAPRAA